MPLLAIKNNSSCIIKQNSFNDSKLGAGGKRKVKGSQAEECMCSVHLGARALMCSSMMSSVTVYLGESKSRTA